jgi:hypothetical protein
MIRLLLLSALLILTLSSCQDIDEDIIPVVGVYRAHVVGIIGPFDLIISTDGGDDIIIEAPFDGFDWYTVKADIDDQTQAIMDINIRNQEIDNDIKMKGSGFYNEGTIELKYSINFGSKVTNFTIVGTKF